MPIDRFSKLKRGGKIENVPYQFSIHQPRIGKLLSLGIDLDE